MFNKKILIVLACLLAVFTVITACLGPASPTEATPLSEKKPAAVFPTPTLTPSPTPPGAVRQPDKDIPEFTVKELHDLVRKEYVGYHIDERSGEGRRVWKEGSRFAELTGKTIRVRGVIYSITAGRYEWTTQGSRVDRLEWSICLMEDVKFGSSGELKTDSESVIVKKIPIRPSNKADTQFLSALIKKTSSWERGDRVVLEGKLLGHYTMMENVIGEVSARTRTMYYRGEPGGVITLKVEGVEKLS